MNTKTVKQSLLARTAFLLTASTLSAQTGGPFNLSWNTIDAGGGACSGGRFRLSGTAGPADAGTCLGGAYQLGGGFQAAFQKPAGSQLNITSSSGGVIVTWPAAPCAGFRLEATAQVSGGPWVDLGEGQLSGPSGADRAVAVGTASPYYFFRLRKACAGACPPSCRE